MTEISTTTSKSEILEHIQTIFAENFEIDPLTVTSSAKLYEDLDIDSIDAVDLVVILKEKTGRKLDPEAFKQVRTVGDMVEAVYDLMNR